MTQNRRCMMGSLVLMWLLAAPLATQAREESAPRNAAGLEEQISSLRQMVLQQQEEIRALKAKAGLSEGDTDAMRKQRELLLALIREENAKKTEAWGWVDNWKIKGDLRYRHEWIDDDTVHADQTRHRLRARLGLFGKVNDEFNVGLQLATSQPQVADSRIGGDPLSTNQTETNWFDRKPVYWDLMYFDYNPKAIPGLTAIGGKMKFPFRTVGDLVWDADVTPEGLAFNYERKLTEAVTLFGAGGGFWVVERGQPVGTVSSADTTLWAAQACAKADLPQVAPETYLLSGCSYYGYGNIRGFAPRRASGNLTRGGNYLSDFNIVNPFAEFGLPVAKFPFRVFADLAHNSSADSPVGVSKNRFGWMIGAQLGRLKNQRDWQIGYDYRSVEPDSILGQFSEGALFGGGTNGTGSRVKFAYQLARNVQIGVSYYHSQLDAFTRSDHPYYQRLQVDLTLKF